MADAEDRQRADLFEVELRRKADLDPGNSWELVWFLQLPLEVRCSYMRILEARIDQHSTRSFLSRQSCYHQRNWREPSRTCLAIDVMHKPTRSWASIDRRQRRKPAEKAHRRARPTRMQAAGPASQSKPAAKREPYHAPARPSTPNGLRKALSADPSLVCNAGGYAPDTLDQLVSPQLPITPYEPLPEPLPEPIPEPPVLEQIVYEPFSVPYPPEGSLVVQGTCIPEDLAYFAAAGHYQRFPSEDYSIMNAAHDLEYLESHSPDFFIAIQQAFSVSYGGGYNDVPLQQMFTSLICNLVHGWSLVPQSWEDGWMPAPEPHPRCPCCTCDRL